MSLMIQMLKKAEQDGVERLESIPGAIGSGHPASVPRRSSWSAWAGWGVAAVVVLFAGPVIVEKWYVKGNATPVASLADTRIVTGAVSARLGTIHAVSEPPGAGVLLDGRFVGVTPLRFQWDSGAVTLTLKKHGFQDLSAPVLVDVAQEVDFRVTLQPETLPVVATSPKATPPAAVTPAVAAGVEPVPPVSIPTLPAASRVVSASGIAAMSAGADLETDTPLKLAGVIRHPPEIRLAEVAKSGEPAKEENKSPKTPKTPKPSKAQAREGDVPVQDVREMAKDPELASLLRQADAAVSASDQLNFAYAIQISAFLDRDSAIRNAALWRKRGYDAYVLELWGVKDPTRLWQSVRVGRFNDLAKARLALEALRRQEKISSFYVARSDSFTPPEGVAPTQAAKIIPIVGPDPVAQGVGRAAVASAVAVTDGFPAAVPGGEDKSHQAGEWSASESARTGKGAAESVSAVATPAPLPILAPTLRKSEPKPEVKPESKPEVNAWSKAEVNPELKPEFKAEPKPEFKAEPKPEFKAEPKPEFKAEPKPEFKAEPKPEFKAELKPEFKAELKPEPKAEVKAEPKPAFKPEPTSWSKAEVKPESKPSVPAGEVRSEVSAMAGPVPTRAEFEAEYPPLSAGRTDSSVERGRAAVVEESMNADRVMGARKIAALQSGVVGVQTAKDVLPEASAWSESEFRASRQTEGKSSVPAATEQKVAAVAPVGSDSRSGTEKPRAVTPAADGRRDLGKVVADQAGWVERTYQQSVEKKDGGDREGEEALLQQVIKADPGHKGAVRRMARIMVETNRGDKALELLRQAAGGRGDSSLADEDPNLAAFLAALYQRREEHWQAIDLYEALLKKYPNKGLWQMGMAISLEKVEENNEAMRAYKKALASGDLNHKLQSFVRKRIEKL
ncbi:MAG: PEGA domain-containing protein [Magnetococcales bacterium]|nr:PEGA domain-containing protein [Magnetococcales bacterium]